MTELFPWYTILIIGAYIGFIVGDAYASWIHRLRLKKVGIPISRLDRYHTCPEHGRELCDKSVLDKNPIHTCPEHCTPWQRFWGLRGSLYWLDPQDDPKNLKWWLDKPAGVA